MKSLRDLGEPVGGFDGIELTVDIDLLHQVDQDHSRVRVLSDVARRHLDREPLVGPQSRDFPSICGPRRGWPAHPDRNPAGLENFGRRAPQPAGRRQHRPADVSLALGENLDEAL